MPSLPHHVIIIDITIATLIHTTTPHHHHCHTDTQHSTPLHSTRTPHTNTTPHSTAHQTTKTELTNSFVKVIAKMAAHNPPSNDSRGAPLTSPPAGDPATSKPGSKPFFTGRTSSNMQRDASIFLATTPRVAASQRIGAMNASELGSDPRVAHNRIWSDEVDPDHANNGSHMEQQTAFKAGDSLIAGLSTRRDYPPPPDTARSGSSRAAGTPRDYPPPPDTARSISSQATPTTVTATPREIPYLREAGKRASEAVDPALANHPYFGSKANASRFANIASVILQAPKPQAGTPTASRGETTARSGAGGARGDVTARSGTSASRGETTARSGAGANRGDMTARSGVGGNTTARSGAGGNTTARSGASQPQMLIPRKATSPKKLQTAGRSLSGKVQRSTPAEVPKGSPSKILKDAAEGHGVWSQSGDAVTVCHYLSLFLTVSHWPTVSHCLSLCHYLSYRC